MITQREARYPLAFAAGAVLAALADTIMPEAYEQGGPTVALSTAAATSAPSQSGRFTKFV